jgi:hypothetical protein
MARKTTNKKNQQNRAVNCGAKLRGLVCRARFIEALEIKQRALKKGMKNADCRFLEPADWSALEYRHEEFYRLLSVKNVPETSEERKKFLTRFDQRQAYLADLRQRAHRAKDKAVELGLRQQRQGGTNASPFAMTGRRARSVTGRERNPALRPERNCR